MITGKIIQRIQSLYSKGAQSDDSRLRPRHIYNKMLTVRSLLVSRRLKKKQKISDWNYTILRCVEIIKVDAHECPCLPQIGCQVYRTKEKLPKPLLGMSSYMIDWVMSIENSVRFDETSRKAELHVAGSRYTNNKKRYIPENGYLYFYGGNPGSAVSVKLLVADPEEANSFPQLCDDNTVSNENLCTSPLDREFPIEDDLIEDMITISTQELIGMFSQGVEDLTNNTRDNVIEQSK